MTVSARVRALIPIMQQRAAALDAEGAFPAADLRDLRDTEAFVLNLPVRQAWRDDALADQLADVLTWIGCGNLSVGRLYEAHINALQLIGRYGTTAQWRVAMQDVEAGHIFALWVTDPQTGGLKIRRSGATIRLSGAKQFCSGAGHVTRVLVTAWNENHDAQMLVLPLGRGETVSNLPSKLAGMRAAVTGAVDFTGCESSADSLLGQVGDYLREPDFSTGAWRGSAVALGGLITLVEHAVAQLQASGRINNPHTLARMGQAMIARETSRMWVRRAGRMGEDVTAAPGDRLATVGLGRIAVESACLDTMRWVQRSLGLSAFGQGNPVERVCRDLATYLRQPAPDQTLTEAASWFVANPS
jgi:alkylation response protein AidB-like acyl-CoA dehydrogenase